MSDNAYINDLEGRNAELRRELAEAKDKIAQLEAFDAANKAAIERSWTFTPEHLAKVRNDPVSITDRLRGDYGGRSFPASAICVVAADMLDEAKAQLTAANATIAETKSELSRHQSLLTRATEALDTANATIAACKAAGFIDAEGRVRKNAIDDATDAEAARWQTAVDRYVFAIDPDRDGSGIDSGDPLDLTDAEICGALSLLSECMNDLLKAPMGVVPKSCERFYRNGTFDIYGHTKTTPAAAKEAQ